MKQTEGEVRKQMGEHQHCWVRLKKRVFGVIYYMCDHPDCFEKKQQSELLGKKTLCSECHVTKFILSREDLRRVRPKCVNCSKASEKIAKRSLETRLDRFFTERTDEKKVEDTTL